MREVCDTCDYDECSDADCISHLMVTVEKLIERQEHLESIVKELLKAHAPTLVMSDVFDKEGRP